MRDLNTNETAEASEAWGALMAIDPGIARDEWVRVGMAALAAGLTLDDLVDWSRPAPNFKSEADVRATFRKVKLDGGIGKATLFHIAKDHGWVSESFGPDSTSLAHHIIMGLSRRMAARSAGPTSEQAAQDGPPDAAAIWDRFVPADASHPYIVEKSGIPDGLRVVPKGDPMRIMGESMAGALVVPMTRADGSIASLQFIAPPETAQRLKAQGKPSKLNLPGASMDGWLTIGAGDEFGAGTMYLCEGIGTAWACHKATGQPAVVCFGWQRVGKVAKALRSKDASIRIVLVPDAGKEAEAQAIASDLGVSVAAMPAGSPSNYDAADLLKDKGAEALAELLTGATRAKSTHVLAQFQPMDLVPRPPAFVIPDLVDSGVVTFAGGHGVGKTSSLLPLAMVAAGLCHPNDPLKPKEWRHVVYVAEDVAQAKRIIAGIVRFGGLGISEDDVRERLHLVEARRLPPELVAQVGAVYRAELTRTARGLELLPLVVLDTNAAVLDLQDSNANAEISRAMAQLKQGFSGLPVWLVCHLSKAIKRSQDTAELSALGGVAFEADSQQNLYLVHDDRTDARYLKLGKARFEKRWTEMAIESHSFTTSARDEYGDMVAVPLRWNTIKPAEKSIQQARAEAMEQQRKDEETRKRTEILDTVEGAWAAGNPVNRTGLRLRIGGRNIETSQALEQLMGEGWVHEITIPKNQRTHPKRDGFLIRLTDAERRAYQETGELPPEKVTPPPTWIKAADPAD